MSSSSSTSTNVKRKEKDQDIDEDLIKFEKGEKIKPFVVSKPHVVEKSDPNQKLSEGLAKASSRLEAAFARLEKVEKQLNLVHEKPKNQELPALTEFDTLVNGCLPNLVVLSFQISDLLEDQIDRLLTALSATRALLSAATECKRSTDWEVLCRPIAKFISDIVAISEHNRASGCAELLSLVSRAAPSLAWIAASDPVLHISQFRNPTETLISKFIKDNKSRENFISFAENFSEFWKGLESYVQKHYAKGLSWNQNGKEAPHLLKFPKRGYPFGITKGISPKLHIDNTNGKWYCEHQCGPKVINVEGEKKQTCYIHNCENGNIQVKGKASTIIVDGCWYLKLVVEGASVVYISNCFSLVIVCNGPVNVITINKSHKCHIKYLDKESYGGLEINSVASTKLTLLDIDGSTTNEIPTLLRTKLQRGKLTVL